MLIEAAIGTAVSFLWGRLEKTAESRDQKNAIKKALEDSIKESFSRFEEKYPDFTESFFNQELLEQHVSPEIDKFLTRNQQPDIEIIVKALPDYVVLSDDSEHKGEITEFFNIVMDSMKKHAVLQEIINSRQIDETNQIVKDIKEDLNANEKLLENSFQNIDFQQKQTNQNIEQLLAQGKKSDQHINQLYSLLNDRLPASKGDELNKFISKQLDRARDLITSCQVDDAQALLKSMEEEVAALDDYTRFRWHTNMGACLQIHDKRREAAEQFLTAYDFAKDDEKAVANRVRALLLLEKFEEAIAESEKAIVAFPECGIIWALHINAKNQLNDTFEAEKLSDKLKQDSSVLLMLSDVRLREKKYHESFEFAKKSYDMNRDSNDSKRAMLISALSWATSDLVKSHYKQLNDNQIDALRYSVESFGSPVIFLKKIQSRNMFTEVAHNLAVSAELIGNEQLKNEITAYAFSVYPDENTFIWYRIKELKKLKNIDEIHNLTDHRLAKLEKLALFSLAEISANRGDLEWNRKILSHIEAGDLDQHEKNELLGIKICALWKHGEKNEALTLVDENYEKITTTPSLTAFYIRLLDENGEVEERNRFLDTCKQISDNSPSYEIIAFADILFDYKCFFDAANLYSKLIVQPSDDYLTKRYLESLIKSEQRAKAVELLDKLPQEIRQQSFFRRSEANLARALGDLNKLEALLVRELKIEPNDSGVAAGYVATLYRKNKSQEIRKYLSNNPVFDPVIVENEIEIAKYQIEVGLVKEAMHRMYSLFRAEPNNSQIAGHYLLFMLDPKNTDLFKTEELVSVGTAVYLDHEGQQKTIVIEPSLFPENKGWPGCISENSKIAKQLLGRKLGETVSLDIGMAVQDARIIRITSMFIFASDNAHKVVAETASSSGPVWSVNVKKPDGKYNFNEVLASLKNRRLHVEHVFSVYDKYKIPLQMLASSLGTDIVSLLLEWPFKEFNLFVSSGLHDERERLKEIIEDDKITYVLDITAITELARLDLLEESLVIFGKPLVTPSLREQLVRLIHVRSKMEPGGTAFEIDGHIHYRDIPEEYLENRKKFLNKILDFIDANCVIVPVIGPQVVTEEQAAISERLGYSSQDLIYLSLEKNALLITEDGGFRSYASNIGLKTSCWLQPLLMVLRDKNVIAQEKYSECILDKIHRRHSFTSVTSDDLIYAARKNTNKISNDIKDVVETFKDQSLDIASGVVVGAQFLRQVAQHVSETILYKYYLLIFEALTYGREAYVEYIHEALRSHIVSVLDVIDRRKAKKIIAKFGNKLNPPPPEPLRLKPIAHAIMIALGH